MAYEKPDFNVTVFEIDDIITTSTQPESQLFNDDTSSWYQWLCS